MMLQARNLASLPGLRHGFFGRRGGVSEGVWASLNVGQRSGDDLARVAANRARCAQALGCAADRLVVARQVHGTLCAKVDVPWDGEPAAADGLATREPGLLLGVVTADCAPVLFADAGTGVTGACHAGWRGALDGVAESTLAAMRDLGADIGRVQAAIGPCIASASYEVGPEFRDRFLEADPASADLFAVPPGGSRPHFDLKAFLARRLRRAGVASVEVLPDDTCADEAGFFSYRRTTLRGEGRFGLQLSAIGLA